MIRINDILDKLLEYNTDDEIRIVEQAYVYSARVHEGQMRLSGEPYLSHPLEVANLLADMKLDVESVAAGLLHDVIEDTHATHEEITAAFGKGIAHIVSGVTKLSTLPYHSSEARQAENIRKMILAMADDIRVILIKLADRIHNMRTLQYHKKEEKRKMVARETFEIYAPIAGRLGIFWIKKELEDISFMYLHKEAYNKIESLLNKGKEERDTYIETVKRQLNEIMTQANLEFEVLGRYKHYYSIYHKMQTQNLEFEELYDIIAFRIILSTVPECYEALGLLHATYRPIANKFKDYIGMPKANMYQSLHTTVIGPLNERIEIQIRTQEMDRIATSGIAAHWTYKEGQRLDEKTRKTFAWIQDLVDNQKNIKDPREFLENVRIDLFPDEIYVFTPQGDIKSLPAGATPVDFAYMIHSEVGNQCCGAKVNGRLLPLNNELRTGDIVEVITVKDHHPSKDWLNFVKTVKARSRIKHWIKTQEKKRSISLGREMCEKAFRKKNLNFTALHKTPEMEPVMGAFGFKTIEDMIASVGYGKITPLQIINKFQPDKDKEESIVNKWIKRVRKKKDREGVIVKGLDDILIKFGKCCSPVPGDPITGFITQGQGVTIHRENCQNARNMNSERQIDVEWNQEISETYPVEISITSFDRQGLLADIASTISQNGANIQSANSGSMDGKYVKSHFTIAVSSTEQLQKIISSIKKIKQVQRVERIDRDG